MPPFSRIEVETGVGMRGRLQALGMFEPGGDGRPYWDAEGAYVITAAQSEVLLEAAGTLHGLCVEVVDEVITAGDQAGFGVASPAMAQAVETSWRAQDAPLLGRMDFSFAADGSPRLMDYEADGPLCLPEASYLQWEWFEAWKAEHGQPGDSQENLLYENLVEAWKALAQRGLRPGFPIAVGGNALPDGMPDDTMERFTAEFMAETAEEAGLGPRLCGIGMIGWDTDALRFTGPKDEPLTTLVKLYPWCWMEQEPNVDALPANRTQILPAAWTRLLADKTLLARLWAKHRGHPLLLPASLMPGDLSGPVVSKPVRGRDGAQVTVPGEAPTPRLPGETDDTGPLLYQQACPLPVMAWPKGRVHVAASVWLVNGKASAISFRDSTVPVTGANARFVPHLLRG